MTFTTRTARRLIMGAALAGLAIGAPAIALASTAAPAKPAAASISQVPACETPGLVIWLTSQGAGGGSAFYTLNFTNLSGHTCTLDGYPFLHAANLKGNNVGRRAAFDSSTGKPTLVTIKNDHTATAKLQVVDALNFVPSQCGPATEAGFLVFPPNQQRGKIVPLPVEACTKMGKNFMSVRPVK